MSVKIMVSLIAALLAHSFVLIYGLQAIDDLEANGGLPIQTAIFANGARSMLFIGTAFVSAITIVGVRRLVKDR